MHSGTIEEKIYQRQLFKEFLTRKILLDPTQRRVFPQRTRRDLFQLNLPEEIVSVSTQKRSEKSGMKKKEGSGSKREDGILKVSQQTKTGEENDGVNEMRIEDGGALSDRADKDKAKRVHFGGRVNTDGGKKDGEKRVERRTERDRGVVVESKFLTETGRLFADLDPNVKARDDVQLSKEQLTAQNYNSRYARKSQYQSNYDDDDDDDDDDENNHKSTVERRKSKIPSKVGNTMAAVSLCEEDEIQARNGDDNENGNDNEEMDRTDGGQKTNRAENGKEGDAEDDWIVAGLLKGKRVQSALSHDKLLDLDSSKDRHLVHLEAEKVAKKAFHALQESRRTCASTSINKPTWTGTYITEFS